MSIHRASLLKLFAWVATLCMASSAGAQVRIPYENTIEDLQFFAPADRSQYGEKPYLKEGWFFNADALGWSVAKAERSVVGSPFASQVVFNSITLQDLPRPEISSLDTGAFDNAIHSGTRVEFGQQCSDGWSWTAGGFQLNGQKQDIAYGEAAIIFDDPGAINQGNFISFTAINPYQTNFNQTYDLDVNGNGIYGRYGRDNGTFVAVVPGQPQLTFVPIGTTITIFQTTFIQQGFGLPPIPVTSAVPFTGFRDGLPDSFFPTVTPFDLGDIRFAALDFNYVNIMTNTHVNSYELMGAKRLHKWVAGGHLDFAAGVRYYEFDEWFRLDAKGHIPPSLTNVAQSSTTGGLANLTIDNDAYNRVIGPQVGLRLFKTWGSLTGSFEARAMAGVNAQSVKLRSAIGTDPSSIVQFQKEGNDNLQTVQFTPIGELRFNFAYQMTRAIALRAGWTGLYAEGLARPSNMINYELPNAKINRNNNSDDAFIQGLNVGVEINR